MRSLIVDDVIINAPIKDILERLQITLTNGKLRDIQDKGDNLLVTCPHHGNGQEHTPACNIYVGNDSDIAYGYFRCFVCEEQGSFLKFVAECFDSSEEFAKNWLLKTFDGHIIEKQVLMDDPIDLNKIKNKNKVKVLDEKVLDQYQSWHPYLAQRKLSRQICEMFKVKYDPKYRQIIFPAYDIKGRLVMLPKRSIDTKTFYLDKDVEKPVYCLDKIQKENYDTALIVEGPIDCLTGWEYGFPTIATLGRISDDQIEQINKSCINILYIMFDNDDAGRSFTKALKRKLAKRIIAIETQLPPGKKDINDCTREEVQEVIKKAKNSSL